MSASQGASSQISSETTASVSARREPSPKNAVESAGLAKDRQDTGSIAPSATRDERVCDWSNTRTSDHHAGWTDKICPHPTKSPAGDWSAVPVASDYHYTSVGRGEFR